MDNLNKFVFPQDILSDSAIAEVNKVLLLDQPIIDAFLRAAALVRSHDDLRDLVISCRDRIDSGEIVSFKSINKEISEMLKKHHNQMNEVMGKERGMFAALVILICIPDTLQRYRSKGIPIKILVDTMSDLAIWMRHYFDEHGIWGLDNIGWLLHHVCGRLYRLGRLQFMAINFQGSFIIFRNIHTREVIALSEEGIDFRGDGRVDGTNQIYDENNKWTSHYSQTTDYYMGNPISANGLAHKEPKQLSTEDWEVMLQRGDSVLDIHIAEGSRMTHQLCRESFFEAVEFYNTYVPETTFRAFVCTSWLMDSQFQKILSPSSNIVKFQKEFYLLPVLSGESETYQRVFGSSEIDLSTASRDTGLRRAILDYAAQGKLLHAAAGFKLMEEL